MEEKEVNTSNCG